MVFYIILHNVFFGEGKTLTRIEDLRRGLLYPGLRQRWLLRKISVPTLCNSLDPIQINMKKTKKDTNSRNSTKISQNFVRLKVHWLNPKSLYIVQNMYADIPYLNYT